MIYFYINNFAYGTIIFLISLLEINKINFRCFIKIFPIIMIRCQGKKVIEIINLKNNEEIKSLL